MLLAPPALGLASISSVNISPIYPVSSDNLSATVGGSFDTVAYNWYRDGESRTVLNLPMTNTSPTYDYSGNGYDGSLKPNASAGPVWNDTGKVGGAYEFDGTDDGIDTADIEMSSWTDLTVSAWIRTTNTSGYQRVVSKDEAGQSGNFILWFYSGVWRMQVHDGGAWSKANFLSTSINDGDWHHLAGVVDNSADKVYIYVDGVLKKSDTFSASTLDDSNNDVLTVGADSDVDAHEHVFHGSIDEVRVYNESLSAERIRRLNATSHNKTFSNSTSTGEAWQASATPITSSGENGSTVWSGSVGVGECGWLGATIYNDSVLSMSNVSCQVSDDLGFGGVVNLSNVTFLTNTSTYVSIDFTDSSSLNASNFTVRGVSADEENMSCSRPSTSCGSYGSLGSCEGAFGCKWDGGSSSCVSFSCSGRGEQDCVSVGDCVWNGSDRGHSTLRFLGSVNISDGYFRNIGIDNNNNNFLGVVFNGSGEVRNTEIRDTVSGFYPGLGGSSVSFYDLESSYSYQGFVEDGSDSVQGLLVNHTDYGVYLVDGVSMSDVVVYNFSEQGVYVDSNSYSSDGNVLDNFTIYNTGSSGKSCIYFDQSSDNVLNNSELYNCSDSGGNYYELYVSDSSQNNTVENTVFAGGDGYGSVIDGHNTTFRNITGKHYKGGSGWDSVINLGWNNLAHDNLVTDSLFYDNNDLAVFVYGFRNTVENSVFYNNTLTNNYAPVDVSHDYNVVYNNTVKDEYRGVEVGVWAYDPDYTNITENVFYNIESKSIKLGSYSENTSVWNNNILDKEVNDTGTDNTFCVDNVGNFYNDSITEVVNRCDVRVFSYPNENQSLTRNMYSVEWGGGFGVLNNNYNISLKSSVEEHTLFSSDLSTSFDFSKFDSGVVNLTLRQLVSYEGEEFTMTHQVRNVTVTEGGSFGGGIIRRKDGGKEKNISVEYDIKEAYTFGEPISFRVWVEDDKGELLKAKVEAEQLINGGEEWVKKTVEDGVYDFLLWEGLQPGVYKTKIKIFSENILVEETVHEYRVLDSSWKTKIINMWQVVKEKSRGLLQKLLEILERIERFINNKLGGYS